MIKLDKNKRHDIINDMNYKDTVKYYKYIEKKQNENLRYKSMYNEDIKLLNKDNQFSSKVVYPVVPLVGGKMKDYDKMKDDEFKAVYDNKMKEILKYGKGEFCNKVITDSECILRSGNLEEMFKLLEIYQQKVTTKRYWKIVIYGFIDFLMCCGEFYNDSKFEYLRNSRIMPIVNIIKVNKSYVDCALGYIDVILHNNPSIFIPEYHNLQRRKLAAKAELGDKSANYLEIKLAQDNLIKKYGFGLILINKILFSYREQ
jgi:hypothetical protein